MYEVHYESKSYHYFDKTTSFIFVIVRTKIKEKNKTATTQKLKDKNVGKSSEYSFWNNKIHSNKILLSRQFTFNFDITFLDVSFHILDIDVQNLDDIWINNKFILKYCFWNRIMNMKISVTHLYVISNINMVENIFK